MEQLGGSAGTAGNTAPQAAGTVATESAGLAVLRGTCVACFGPYTAANARALGLGVDLVSKDFSSFGGFAASLEEHLASV